MKKSIDVSGRTEDAAIADALAQTGKAREDVSVEVLERAKTGFLGIGSSPAKIRVSWEEQSSKLAELESFLGGLFQRMGVEAQVKAEMNEEENVITCELAGEHVGALIGRRGETLDAIQHLANYVVNKGENERTRINIDAENYRAKRADALTHLAKKVAAKVVKYRRNMTLEPMNAYERHVIHTALQDFEGVSTYSTGTEPNRRVVVAYGNVTEGEAPAEPPRRSDARPPRSGRYGGGRPVSRGPRPSAPARAPYAAPVAPSAPAIPAAPSPVRAPAPAEEAPAAQEPPKEVPAPSEVPAAPAAEPADEQPRTPTYREWR